MFLVIQKTIPMNSKNFLLLCIFCILNACYLQAQTYNTAMDFDGDNDYVSLNTTGTPVSGDSDFTVELWFSITSPITGTCGSGAFRRLFVLSGTTVTETNLK